ncbi:MAG: hypothetical protein ABIR66_02320 [Saprospiraceae bacterium]
MRCVLIFLLLLFTTPYLSGQVSTGNNTDWNKVLVGKKAVIENNGRKVIGTPFAYEEYLPGSVYLSDSLHSPDKLLFKLNILRNEIWLQQDVGVDKIDIILSNPRIVALVLTKEGIRHSFKRLLLPFNRDVVRKFVELFYCGSLILIKEIQKELIQTKVEDNGIVIVNPATDRYETREIYYLADEDGVIKKIRLKISDVYELYPIVSKKNKSDLESYCKSKNIDKSPSETQFIEFLSYLSTFKVALNKE